MTKNSKRITAAALCVLLALQLPAGVPAGELILPDSPEEITAAETSSLPETVSAEAQESELYYDEEAVLDERTVYDAEDPADAGELIISEEVTGDIEQSSEAWEISEADAFPADETLDIIDEEYLMDELLPEETDQEEEILENEEETIADEVFLDEDKDDSAELETAEPPSLPAEVYTIVAGNTSMKQFSVAFEPALSVKVSDEDIVTASLTRGETDTEGNTEYTVRFTGLKPGVCQVQVYWENEGTTYNVKTYGINVAQRVYLAEGDNLIDTFSASGITEVIASSGDESIAGIMASVSDGTVTSELTANAPGTTLLSIDYNDNSGNIIPLKRYYVTVVSIVEVALKETKSQSFRWSATREPEIRLTDYDQAVVSGSVSVTGPDLEDKYRATITLTAGSVGETRVYLWNRTTLTACYHVAVTKRFPNPTINVSPASLRLFTGKTAQINVSGLVQEDTVVSWKSDKTGIATVNASGLVTAKSAGTAKITVTLLSGLKKDIPVTVVKPSITVKADASSLKVGGKTKIRASFVSGDRVISYTSSNSSILQTDSSGNVTAKMPGSALVTVKLESGISGSVKIKVTLDAPAVKVCYNGISGIGVYWNSVSGADGYEIYRRRAGKTVRVGTAGENASSFIDTSVKENNWGRVFVYLIRAKCGSYLTYYGQGYTVQRVAPPMITSCRSNSKKSASLKWGTASGTVNTASGFEIQYAESNTDLYNRTGTSRTTLVSGRYNLTKNLTGLKSGKTYYFRMRAYVYYTNSVTGKTTRTWSQYGNVRAIKIK